MSNVQYKFKRGNESGLSQLPVEDGSIIVTKDTHQLFIDIDNTRHDLTPKLATDEDIVAMFSSNGTNAVANASVEPQDHTTTAVFEGSDNPEVVSF